MHLTKTRWQVDQAKQHDLPEIARLLIELYRAEAPWSVPAGEAAFAKVLETGLRGQTPGLLESSLVARDLDDPTRLAAYVAMSPDHSPRRPLFSRRYLSAAVRLLGPVSAARVLWYQFRMMGLLCSPLVPGAAQLHSLVVDPAHRGEGLAVELVRAVEELAISHDQDSVVLFIFDGNPVERFYQDLGYTRVPLPRPRFPMPQQGIAMQRALRTAVS
jgi:ribosomal protein S18 acetylase RimI-like enzyme